MRLSYKVKMTRFISIICCAFILCMSFLPLNVLGENNNNETDSKVVKIGWYQSDLFQEGMSDDEAKSGYCYEYIHKVEDYNNWTYEYVYGDWTELYAKLLNGEIDILAGISKTEERMDKILYPDEVMGYEHYVLYEHEGDSMDATDITTFQGKKIGAITDNLMTTYLEKWVADNQVDVEIVYYDSFQQRDDDFDAGVIDALVTTNNGVLTSSGYAQVVEVGKESYYLAVAKNREDLLSDLNRALDYMEDIEPYFITNLEYECYGTTLANSTLSNLEQVWLDNHSTLTIGILNNYLPYCSMDENGTVYGLIVDVIDAIKKQLNIADQLNVVYQAYSSSDELISALKAGEVDAVFPVSGNTWDLEQEGINATNDIVNSYEELVYKGEYSDDKVTKIAVSAKNKMSENYLRSMFPDAEIIKYPTINECLEAVKNGEVGATMINGLRIDLVRQDRKYSSLSFRQLEKTDGRTIGVLNDNTALQMLLNRGIRLIGENFGTNAAYNYMGDLYQATVTDFLFDHLGLVLGSSGIIIVIIVTYALLNQKKSKRIIRLETEKNEELAKLNEQLKAEDAEKEKYNIALKAASEEAKSANKAKTEFLFNMSHDIRTPMNAILGYTDLIEKHFDDPELCKDYIGKMRSSGDFLLTLINNVLEMARIESGKESLNEEVCSIISLQNEIISVYTEQMKKKNLSFKQFLDIKNEYIYADRVKVCEIFLNILSNAYKYTPAGGSVETRVKELPCDIEGYTTIQIKVSDTGIGMSKEYQKVLFEEFSREHNSTDSKIQGTGLGMPIVKKLVDLMKGTIEVESEVGKGSTFTVTLTSRIAEKPTQKAEIKEEDNIPSFTGRRLLMAEDNDLNAEIAIEILSDAGFEVERAEDGNICVDMLQKASQGYYDAILMDIQMPNMNGYEATKLIRKLPDVAKSQIPIIAMTANAFDSDKKDAMEAGMNGHVAKPIDVSLLLNTLAEFVK